MARGSNLTYKMKRDLEKYNIVEDANDYLYTKNTNSILEIIHKDTKEKITVDKKSKDFTF